MQEIVINFIYPINAIQVTKLLNDKQKTLYKPNLIRKLLKLELNCSFKKVKPRPSCINMDKICAVRQLFAVRFWQQITSNTLVVNIDETSINRHIKSNFSWGIIGIPKEAINSPFVGSISLIMEIWSNGDWMAYINNEIIDDNWFCIFLSNLNK